MKLYIPNLKTKYLLIFDIEYDGSSLVQLAFLILYRLEPDIFVLSQSVNVYIRQSQRLNNFFTKYTNITDDFLREEGLDLPVAKTLVADRLLNIDANNCTVVSHGIKNDLEILIDNGIDFYCKDQYCTYEAAKKLLNRSSNLTLKEVASEGGYFMFNEHNAYADVWGTLHAFCYLKEIEDEIN